MERGERLFWSVMGILLLFLTALVMWQVMQTDYSLRQAEHRHKFGAVYMTLNNPFYEIVDEEIRMEVSRRGDILISRDPALSVERQEEAVKELIDSGVELIFINPVDWQRIAPALQLAKEANVLQMWLTHYSPSLFKPKDYIENARKIFPGAIAAKDGMSADLRYDEM